MTDPNDIMFGGVRWMDRTASPYGEQYEEIYQAFKARLIREVVARHESPHTALWINHELHDKMNGD